MVLSWIPGRDKTCFSSPKRPEPPWDPRRDRGVFPGGREIEREVYSTSPSGAEVKNPQSLSRGASQSAVRRR